MSSTIDWSKAPAGTIGHGIVGECLPVWIGADWYEHAREDGGRYFFADVGVPVTAWRRADVTNYVARPTESPTWNGEGLPPVGTVCEIYWGANGWKQCTVFAHKPNGSGSIDALVDLDGDWNFGSKFRPIRTPEQIAAEARESAIDEMVNVWRRTMGRFALEERGLAEMLYDVGYRKVEQP